MKYFWAGLAAVFVGAIALEVWAKTRILKATVRLENARADAAEAVTIEARALLAQEGTWVQIKERKR